MTEHPALSTEQAEGSQQRWRHPGDSLTTTRLTTLQTCWHHGLILLLLSGDVHINPGPVQQFNQDPCGVCQNQVKSGEKGIQCDSCDVWHHVRCLPAEISLTDYQYDVLSSSDAEWLCHTCKPSAVGADLKCEAEPAQTEIENDDWTCLKKKGLYILHLNVRSLLPKIDEVRNLAHQWNPSVLCFSETWLDCTILDPEVDIPGYSCVRKDRDRNGGGVVVYIRNNIAFNVRPDMMDNDLEAVWVNILLPKTKAILLGACYRPPDVNNFYNILEEVCLNAEGFVDSEVIITGDFNTNVSTSKANSLVNSLKYFCSMFDLHQMITEPTRVCESSQTTIDLMLVSDQDKICQSCVITCGMSDHMAIYCTRKVLRSKATGHNTIKVRSMKHYTAEVFCERLSMIDWSSVLNCMNVDQAWRNFTTMFIYVLDSIAPVKSISVKHRTEPWVSTEILEAINRRDQALKESKKSNDQSEFKRLRNKVNRMIDKAKVDYYKNNLQLNHNNPKKLWQLCKQLGSSKKQKSNFLIGLKIDGIVSFNLTAVVLKFNSFLPPLLQFL
ncbi:uncharacterized protein LOC132901016 [Neoarius graeffei]|uniref:uncharacterized protein LOC132901016 n=1 Tax=Neoarius graeffei TaxID=443677 RepID=UPI00298C99D4|nr:uncharacterized protein LOC132901016 [Neoarius graeffei]